MGHELVPRSGALPGPNEVARLLATEFRYVRFDADVGLRRARSVAAWLESASPVIFHGRHREVLEHAARLKALTLGEALEIEFGDDDQTTMQFVIIPGEGIRFGYSSREEEEAKRGLLERCASVLGCEIELF